MRKSILRMFSSRRMWCGFVPLFIPLALAAQSKLSLQVSSEIAPPGGWAQVKVFAAAPAPISAGTISMDFEPVLFGDIANIAVFSATGDQIGYANVTGRHVDAHFSSSAAAIGQLPGLPVFVVSIPVLPIPFPGVTTAINVKAADFKDALGKPYSLTVTPGKVTIRGSLSVESVLPENSGLTVRGTGFTADTTVAIDGVAIASMQHVSAQQIDVTLGGATELTGKHLRVANPDGVSVDYFCALPSAPASPPEGLGAVTGVHPILPLETYTNVELGTYRPHPFDPYGFALLNPNAAPLTVTLEAATAGGPPTSVFYAETMTIPPGTLYFIDAVPIVAKAQGPRGALWITPSAPIRMVTYQGLPLFGLPVSVEPPPVYYNGEPPPTEIQLRLSSPPILWSVQQGKPAPAPAAVPVAGNLGFTVSAPASAAAWLSITPMAGTAPATLTLTAKTAGLSPGTYTATVTVTPILPSSPTGFTAKPSSIDVSLTVSATPLVGWTAPNCCFFFAPGSSGSSPPEVLTVTSNGDPVPFTASVTGGDWLTVTPSSGTTPADLTLKVSPAGLADGQYSAQVVIQGPSNAATVPVGFFVLSPPPPPPPPSGIQLSPTSVSFLLEAGSGPPPVPQVVTLHPSDIAITAKTDNGGDWMTTAVFSNPAQAVIQVNASAANLSPGTYTATITVTSGALAPVTIPVTLVVVAAPTANTVVTATPPSVSLHPQPGRTETQSIRIESGGTPILVNGNLATPTTLTVQAYGGGQIPGAYKSAITVTWATGSLDIPVTINQPAELGLPPIIASLVNGASQLPGAIAPGEIVTLFGTGLGPVYINGQPAEVLYESSGQVNAIVPGSVGTQGTASIKAVSNGIESQAWEVPLTAAAPAIFTADSSGLGQAAGVGPVARGASIRIYATGAGLPPFGSPKLTIGSIDTPAQVITLRPGFQEIDAIVPQSVAPGPAVPITLTIGGKSSPAGVTISVH